MSSVSSVPAITVRSPARRASLLLSLVLLWGGVMPMAAQARTVRDVTVNPLEARMTRGEFVRQAVMALQLPLSRSRTVPLGRASATIQPYVQTAYEKGALDAFGPAAMNMDAAVTRGEAVYFLEKLLGSSTDVSQVREFVDVDESTAMGKAIEAAVSRQWLQPQSGDTFGIRETFSRKDALQLIRAAIDQPVIRVAAPVRQTITIDVPKTQPKAKKTSQKDLPKQELLQQVWRILNNDYYYHDKVNADTAAYKAAEAMAASVNDPYTVFMPPRTAKNFEDRLTGEVTGIGATVEQKKDAANHLVLTIVAPLRGSPAEKAGIQGGDELLEADGVKLTDLPLEDAVDKVRGAKGTTVKLLIRRDGQEFPLEVLRDTVKIPEIDVSYNGDIAVVQLMQFGQITDDKFHDTMAEVQAKNPKGIVLDLRNNPGGFLHTAGVVLGTMLPKGTLFATVKVNDGRAESDATDTEPVLHADVPMVVLINKGSASASELVAGALQDYKRATIVGETSFGKGSVQRNFSFDDGSSLKVTIAKWYTPKDRGIDGQGITPDIVVTQEPGGRDDPLLKALEILR